MFTQRELASLLEAWRILAEVRASNRPLSLDDDLMVAIRAIVRAYSTATS